MPKSTKTASTKDENNDIALWEARKWNFFSSKHNKIFSLSYSHWVRTSWYVLSMLIINVIHWFIVAPQVLERQKNLKHLSITVAMYPCNSVLEIIGRHCKNLEFLNFYCVRSTEMCMPANLINLKGLKIRYMCPTDKVSSYFINSISHVCKELVSLEIPGKSLQFVTYS